MAPRRRKGGSKSSAEAAAAAHRQWKVGDLVLAKVKGFPAWPAKVSEPEKWGYSSDGKKVLVYFFGTQQIAFSNPIDVEPFTEERKESLLTKRHGKGADFVRAVHEIIDSYEQLKKGEVSCNSLDNATRKKSEISKDNLKLQNEMPDMDRSSCEKSLSVEGKLSDNAAEDSVGIIRDSDILQDPGTTRASKEKNHGNAYFSRKRFRGVQLNSCPSLKKITAPRSSRSGKCILSPGDDGKAAVDTPISDLWDGTRNNIVRESSSVNSERDPNAFPLNGTSRKNGSGNLTVDSDGKLQQIEPDLEHCDVIELNQKPVIVRKKRNQSRKRAIIDSSDVVASLSKDRGSSDVVASVYEDRKRAINDSSDVVASVSEDRGSSDVIASVSEDRGSEVEVLRVGFPDVRLASPDKGDGDKHLPPLKRARIRLGRSSPKKVDLDISTLLEQKPSIILNKVPEHVCSSITDDVNCTFITHNVDCTSITHDMDCTLDTNLHVAKYDISDSLSPKVSSQFAVDQPQALDDRSIAKLDCLVDDEATLPPSKRLHRALEAMSANTAGEIKSDVSLPMTTCMHGSYSNKGSPEISVGGGKKCPVMETFDLSNINSSQGISTEVSTSSELPLPEVMAYSSREEVDCCKLVSKIGKENKTLEILESVDMRSVCLPSLVEPINNLLEPCSLSKHCGQVENMDNHHTFENTLENLESVKLKILSLPSLGESMNNLLDNHTKVEKPLENLESVDQNMDNHTKIDKPLQNLESVNENMDNLHKIEKPLENLERVDENMDNLHKIEKPLENLGSGYVKGLSLPSMGESMNKVLLCNDGSLESPLPSSLRGQEETMDDHHKIENPLSKPDTSHDCEIVSNPGYRDGEITQGLPGEGNLSATTRPSNSPVTEINEDNSVFHVTGDIKQTLKDSHVITSPTTLKDIEAAECLQNLSVSASISLDHTGDRVKSGQGSSSSMTNRLGSIACESPPSTSICNDYTVENDRIVDNTGSSCVLTSHVPRVKANDTKHWSSKTEATAALASFEAALVTLTRTKENITGATRIAIDCAKYGNASKVIEIIAHHLEDEPSLHRRVDLFFLVDSIAQCSRGLKGEVGDTYPSAIQESLKRLLLAAAPPRCSTLENCRQCLKVLRLWLERRILPSSIIRHHIRELESLCCSSSGSAYVKRTMRNDRPFDDPLRQMEGMLVDEYGSNSNFKLAGFCMPPMRKDDQDGGSDSDGSDFEAVTPEHESKFHEEKEIMLPTTTVVKHTCVLEEVDGELEMEDVSPNCDAEMAVVCHSGLGSSNMVHQFDNNIPLPFLPPLPVDMPPSSPPLPTSPPPPPPPFDSNLYGASHNMAAVNPESLPYQMQSSVQGACTSGLFNGHPIPNFHMQQQHAQENNVNNLHNPTYPMHSLQPPPTNQFSYIHSDQWLQSQSPYPPGPVGGNFCNDTGGTNWRFPGPLVTGGSYAQHYPAPAPAPAPVCDPPPTDPNHGWGFPQWNGNHQDFIPHRPPAAEGPMPVPIRAPCFWQPR